MEADQNYALWQTLGPGRRINPINVRLQKPIKSIYYHTM